MKDVCRLLRDGDPLAVEPGLSATDALTIRRAVVAAAETQPVLTVTWPQPMLIAATVVLMLAAGAVVGRWLPATEHRVESRLAVTSSPAVATGRQQLQFATPGGTRIIWVFDPNFDP